MSEFIPELGQMAFSNMAWTQTKLDQVGEDAIHLIANLVAEYGGEKRDKYGYSNLLTSNVGDQFSNDTFALRSYCWCEGDEPNHHVDACPPNFEHFASDITVTWYKHLGRGSTISRDVPVSEWARVINDCHESLAGVR